METAGVEAAAHGDDDGSSECCVSSTPEQLIAVVKNPDQPDATRVQKLQELVAMADLANANAALLAQAIMEQDFIVYVLHLDWTSRSKKRKFQLARWKLLRLSLSSPLIQPTLITREAIQSILMLMASERFAVTETQLAMADVITQLALVDVNDDVSLNLLNIELPDEENYDKSCNFLELMKQFYVTLTDPLIRKRLALSLVQLVTTKALAKTVIQSGFLRSLLQIAISSSSIANEDTDGSTGDNESGDGRAYADELLQNYAVVLAHICSLVCYDTSKEKPKELGSNSQWICELVVRLMLSGVAVAFEESIRLLQMLVEDNALPSSLHNMLIAVMDLRGALEKAHTLVEQKIKQPDLVTLVEQQYQQLIPEIDALERQCGSLVGLPLDDLDFIMSNPSTEHFDQALQVATKCKERGNWFFRRGNFPTARAFYRRAISILRITQSREEAQLGALSKADIIQKCSVGASVRVLQPRDRGMEDQWKNGMISDIEDGQIEIMYDDDDTEELVTDPTRIRLRLNTNTLESFEALEVDCSMNMAKAFSQLLDHEHAVECFSHVLTIKKNHIPALYYRGIAYIALHDLRNAQQDLWNANSISRQLKSKDAQSKALQQQIVAAYKKLQQLHANKKKMDKKIIKQMINYLSTIPELQNDSEQGIGQQ